MNNNSTHSPGVKQVMAGVLLFALPFLSLITPWGVGACSILFFLVASFYWRPARAALLLHWNAVRWVLAAFALHAGVSIIFLMLRPDLGGGSAEKPVRMLLAASAMLVVLVGMPDRRWLWGGVIGGAIAGAMLLLVERFVFGVLRPGGYVNPITAGDLLACLALMSLAASADLRGRAAGWALLGVLAGVAGMLATRTRGCMIAVALGVLIYTWHMRALWWARLMPVVCLALAVGAWFAPATGVRERVMEGVQDMQLYTQQNMAFTSLGLRFELWEAGARLIAERPLLGAAPSAVRSEMEAMVKAGTLTPEALTMPHFHNDVVQVLVFGGVGALLAWLATLAAPLVFFARQLRTRGERSAPALAGVFLTSSYLAFGLTEVIFWSVRASIFYALMVFTLMGLCLNAKEQDGK